MPGDFGDSTTGRSVWEGTVDPNAAGVWNGRITPAQWKDYERKRKRAAIIGYVSTLGGMMAAGGIAGAAGGGSATLPAAATQGIGFSSAGAGAGAAGAAGVGAAGSLAPIAGGSPWAVTPYAGTAAMSGPGAAAAVPAAFSATSGGGTTAPSVSRLGSVMNSNGANLGVNAALAVYGQKSANKANDQARRDLLNSQREALALQRQQLETEARNADLDREDARALNTAINELKKRELDAAEEARAFERSLVEQRETRLAPYRKISEQALNRLSAMWSLG